MCGEIMYEQKSKRNERRELLKSESSKDKSIYRQKGDERGSDLRQCQWVERTIDAHEVMGK